MIATLQPAAASARAVAAPIPVAEPVTTAAFPSDPSLHIPVILLPIPVIVAARFAPYHCPRKSANGPIEEGEGGMKIGAYGPFPYSAIIDRPKLVWPGGARVAVWVNVNLEFFPYNEAVPQTSARFPTCPAGRAPTTGIASACSA